MVTDTRPRLGRLGAKKSSNGCITCKVRKIKCDESQPACKRCMNTGRRCDGYAKQPFLFRLHTPAQPPPLCGGLPHDEQQYLEFYMNRVVPYSSRIADEHFWHQLVPQFSHSDSVVRYAVNAISSLIRYPRPPSFYWTGSDREAAAPDQNHAKALRWYGKSVWLLQERMKTGVKELWLTSCRITCILYICIELLQNNRNQAMAIYERAAHLLVSQSSGTLPQAGGDSLVLNATTTLLRHLCASMGYTFISQIHRKKSSTTMFDTITDAREAIYELIGEAHAFASNALELKLVQEKNWEAPAELVVHQRHILSKLESWHEAFDRLFDSFETISAVQAESYSVAIVGYSQYLIMMLTCLSMFETAYDECLATFRTMIEHARRIIAQTAGHGRPTFVFETRIVPNLFFVANKCRCPSIRREAVALLGQSPEIEGVNRPDPMAKLAKLLIGMEETGTEQAGFLQEPDSLELPPENHRIYRTKAFELSDAMGRPIQYLNFGRWQQDQASSWFKTDHLVKI